MRILIYSYNYHPEPIGIAPLMTELAEGLVKRGHEVRVITSMPNYPERRIYDDYQGKWYLTEEKDGVIIQRSYVWIRPKPGLITRILLDGSFVVTSFIQALKGWRPDVILVTIPSLPVCVPAALLGYLYKCPVVVNVQDILPEAAVHVGLIKNKFAIRIFEVLEKFAYRTAHTISVITEEFTENLVGKGVPKDKITCIPNWANVNFIRPLPKEGNSFRAEHQLDGKFVVLYSGNLGLTLSRKTVLDAAALLRHIPEIVFVIVGESQALDELREFAKADQINNIRFLPFQEREKLPEMLAAADVGLVLQKHNVISFNMPSKTKVLLASGRAIVASVPLTGTVARVIRQSNGGVVIKPQDPKALADAIVDLYNNPDKAASLGQQGREFAVKHYSFQRSLQSYEELFTQISNQSNVIQDSELSVIRKSF